MDNKKNQWLVAQNGPFLVLACHQLVLDGFDQLLSFIMHCPHTLSSALQSINLYDIKKFEILFEKSWERRELNLGQLGEKRQRYLCA